MLCRSILFLLLLLSGTAGAQRTDPWLLELLRTKGSPLLQQVLAKPDTFQYQIIYTRIDRDRNNRPQFTHFQVNTDRNRYFNPASTVKLPTALAALEKMNELRKKGVDKHTALLTDSGCSGQTAVRADPSSATGFPSVAQYVRKILLVSDNDAYNRLYELVGQQPLNESLHRKGYTDVRITRRFVPLTPEENRFTNPVRFVRDGRTVYAQPLACSRFSFDFSRKVLVGRAHYNRSDSLLHEPMDFTMHNNLPLEDLQQMLQSVLFPRSVSRQQRFRLEADDYRLLYHYLSALPSESRYPTYDTTEFFDSYAKFFFKDGRQKIPEGIRIFNKTGWSYGFLTDAAYVADFNQGIEFMLAAVIYVNADGVLNDNKYEYREIGYPFFGALYQVLYQYEQERKRERRPDLSRFRPYVPGSR